MVGSLLVQPSRMHNKSNEPEAKSSAGPAANTFLTAVSTGIIDDIEPSTGWLGHVGLID
ncbi:hypothetical protein E4U17_001938, partial [Claviceps sp. LM77 group G4]